MAKIPLRIAAAGRAYPGESVSGDAWSVADLAKVCRIALIDGLGHGPPAAQAANLALAELAKWPELAPPEALRQCHEALRGTRGAAAAIVDIDFATGSLRFAGVGNVAAQLWRPHRISRPAPFRGIVGVVFPKVENSDYDLGDEWLLVLYTDGISGHFRLEELSDPRALDVGALAKDILADWAHATDDATIVVAAPGGDR